MRGQSEDRPRNWVSVAQDAADIFLSLIDEHESFRVGVRETKRCHVCNDASNNSGRSFVLQLPLPQRERVTLAGCFELFASEEELDADNLWECNTCKIQQRSSSLYTILTFPEVDECIAPGMCRAAPCRSMRGKSAPFRTAAAQGSVSFAELFIRLRTCIAHTRTVVVPLLAYTRAHLCACLGAL